MHSAILAHIEALQAQLEEVEDESDAFEIALLLLDIYEQLLEANDILLIYRGETLH